MWRSKISEVTCPKLPLVRKCCFCIPVRKGIIIFGYINLIVSLLAFPLLVFLLVEQISSQPPAGEEGSTKEPARLPLTIAWVAIDVAMNLALIVNAHKKNVKFLKVYLYFGIAFQALTLFLDLVLFEFGDYVENIIYFFFLSLNVYLLYLVHCTVHVLKERCEVQYVAQQDHLSL